MSASYGAFNDCGQGYALCTKSCDPNRKDIFEACNPKATLSKGEWSHTINTDAVIDLFGTSVKLFATKRSFEWSQSWRVEYGVCGGQLFIADGEIKESIDNSYATFYYLSTSERVCLFKRTRVTVAFQKPLTSIELTVHEDGRAGLIGIIDVRQNDVSVSRSEEIVLLIGGQEKILDSYSMPPAAGSGVWKLFAVPVPDQDIGNFNNPEYRGKVPYNMYPPCDNAVAGTLTELDGGRDMFYPAWARDLVYDPQWAFEAKERVRACNTKEYKYPKDFVFTPSRDIKYDPYPHGDFARHPVLGDCYSWLLAEFGEAKVVNFPDNMITLLKGGGVAEKDIKKLTPFYPISIL